VYNDHAIRRRPERTGRERTRLKIFEVFEPLAREQLVPGSYLNTDSLSKRIIEIAAPLPIKKGERPKHTKSKSGRRNNAKQPQHGDNAATHSTPYPESTPLPTAADCTSKIASVPPKSTNAGGGRTKTRMTYKMII